MVDVILKYYIIYV